MKLQRNLVLPVVGLVALIAVVLAGIGVAAILLWKAGRSPESPETAAPTPDVTTEATLTRTAAAEPAPSTSSGRTPTSDSGIGFRTSCRDQSPP